MSVTDSDKRFGEQRLHNLLATLILVADGYHWPGGDGMLLDDLLREYPKIACQGRLPGRDELCRQHPELALAVADFFDCFRSTVLS